MSHIFPQKDWRAIAHNLRVDPYITMRIILYYGWRQIVPARQRDGRLKFNGYLLKTPPKNPYDPNRGIYDPLETRAIQRLRIRNALDIGANVGYYTCLLAGLGARVHSFEPHPEMYSILLDNIRYNKLEHMVTTHSVALADHTGQDNFFIPKHGNDGMGGLRERILPSEARFRVQVKRLDDIIPDGEPVDFIKIDVEGSESDIIAGGRNTMSRAGHIMMEFVPGNYFAQHHDPEGCFNTLIDMGFGAIHMRTGARMNLNEALKETRWGISNVLFKQI